MCHRFALYTIWKILKRKHEKKKRFGAKAVAKKNTRKRKWLVQKQLHNKYELFYN